MMQCLPVGSFKWMSADEIRTMMTLEKIRSLPEDSKRGYILEVDMHLPDEHHEKMSDYPVAPEKKPINGTQLSNYQRQILRDDIVASMKKDLPPDEESIDREIDDQKSCDYEPKTKYAKKDLPPNEESIDRKIDDRKSCDKLILDYEPKTKYAVHYRNLKLYMQLGMKVTKIHRVLSFEQKPWLAPYIKANTAMRTKATNDFEKDFFKLMNNRYLILLLNKFYLKAYF